MTSKATSTRTVLFVLALASCTSIIVALLIIGCRKTNSPKAQPKIQPTAPSGTFYPHEELSKVDTPGLTSLCFPKVYFGSANGQLAYMIVTDFPMNSNSRLDVTPHFHGSAIDEGTIEIEGRSYRLRNGRVLLVETAGGPDHIHQIVMPPGASTPEGAVRQLFEKNLAFRDFVKDVLYARLDSISLRDEAAIGLYKAKLASELPEAELRDRLHDDSPWVQLMAASGLWDTTQASEALAVLATLAENEQADNWPARLARRELTKIRVGHSQRSNSTVPSDKSDDKK